MARVPSVIDLWSLCFAQNGSYHLNHYDTLLRKVCMAGRLIEGEVESVCNPVINRSSRKSDAFDSCKLTSHPSNRRVATATLHDIFEHQAFICNIPSTVATGRDPMLVT